MNANENALVAWLQTNQPDLLYIARQYGSVYSMTLPNAVRYAVGLLGDNLDSNVQDQVLAMVQVAETPVSTGSGGFTMTPIKIALLGLGAYYAMKG